MEGLKFFTPVGLASGLDCEGEGIEAFFNLGFGFVEARKRWKMGENGRFWS